MKKPLSPSLSSSAQIPRWLPISLRVKAQVLQWTPRPNSLPSACPLPVTSSAPLFPACSLFSINTGFLGVSWTHQACSCLWAFPLFGPVFLINTSARLSHFLPSGPFKVHQIREACSDYSIYNRNPSILTRTPNLHFLPFFSLHSTYCSLTH